MTLWKALCKCSNYNAARLFLDMAEVSIYVKILMSNLYVKFLGHVHAYLSHLVLNKTSQYRTKVQSLEGLMLPLLLSSSVRPLRLLCCLKETKTDDEHPRWH